MPWSLSNCKLIANFGPKMKALKFGNKNTLFGCFGLDVQKLLLRYLTYLKSKLSSLSIIAKDTKKQKPTKKKNKTNRQIQRFWAKKCLTDLFLGWNLKIIFSCLKS